MTEATPSPSQQAYGNNTLILQRYFPLPLNEVGATTEQLAAYLALVDRPLEALLARDRLQTLDSGRFLYCSKPFRILHLELVPTLDLRACFQDGSLHLRSEECRITGLGRWATALTFGLAVELQPAPALLGGRATVWLDLPSSIGAWGRPLAARALEQVLDRMQRRFSRGLCKDLRIWLMETRQAG